MRPSTSATMIASPAAWTKAYRSTAISIRVALLVWVHYEQSGGVYERLRTDAAGWAAVTRVSFALHGADVQAL